MGGDVSSKKTYGKLEDRTMLGAVKEQQGGQVSKLEEAQGGGGGGIKVLEDRTCTEQSGGYMIDSFPALDADQDTRSGAVRRGYIFKTEAVRIAIAWM